MEVQLESLDLFILFSYSDVCAIITKEFIIQHTMYCFKVDPGFSDLIRFNLNSFDL